jgi:hypothetical protein
MATHNPRCRMGAHLLLMLAFGIPCSVVGCSAGDSKPAPTTEAQGKQIQQHFAGYREQLISEAKSQAKAKANNSGKKSP